MIPLTLLNRLTSIHRTIAERISAPGGVLRCDKCGHERPCSTADTEQYLKHGWPRCCGRVMSFIPPIPPAGERTHA